MIEDELMNKFDSIEDLPISEEMLGAYMEGKLDIYDMDNINMLVHNNPTLQSIAIETANDVLEFITNLEPMDYELYDTDYMVENVDSEINRMDMSDCKERDVDTFIGLTDIDSIELPDIF